MVRVQAVRLLHGFLVRLTFTDGSERDVDLSRYMHGPVFEPIRTDRADFDAVSVDREFGTIVWPNGADVDPDVLYWGRTPAWAEGEVTVGTERASGPV